MLRQISSLIPWTVFAEVSLVGWGPLVCGPGKPEASALLWYSCNSLPAHWAWASMAPLWRSQCRHPSAVSKQQQKVSWFSNSSQLETSLCCYSRISWLKFVAWYLSLTMCVCVLVMCPIARRSGVTFLCMLQHKWPLFKHLLCMHRRTHNV